MPKPDLETIRTEAVSDIRENNNPMLRDHVKTYKYQTISCTDEHGNTLLHVAAEEGNQFAALLLMQNFADPRRKNYAGETPADVAKKMDNGLEELFNAKAKKLDQAEEQAKAGVEEEKSSGRGRG